MATEFDRDSVIAQVTERLAEKFDGLDRSRIEAIVTEEVDELADKPVHDYVAVLGERAAKKRVKDELHGHSS